MSKKIIEDYAGVISSTEPMHSTFCSIRFIEPGNPEISALYGIQELMDMILINDIKAKRRIVKYLFEKYEEKLKNEI